MSRLSPEDIAAQALCLLAQPEERPQLNTAGRTEDDDDDCVITLVRPAPHRHHPYRRPGEQFDAATVTRARRDAPPRTPAQRWADESRAFAALQIAFPLDTYTYRSLVLQALLAAPESEWLHSSEITEYLTDKYPAFRGGKYYLTTIVCLTLRDFFSVKAKIVEKTKPRGVKHYNLWRVLPEARDKASTIAFRKKPVRGE